VSRLIEAAQAVSQGDLSVQIKQKPLHNEMDNLVTAFNTMTNRLQQQSEEIAFNQRKAAWADIARKIAHEIKNPLTPIQLSAERLKRRYLKEISTDPETFIKCVDTIIRQVNHIGSLVQEFSSFARMPEPNMKQEDLCSICLNAVELQKQAYCGIKFNIEIPDKPVLCNCDSQQIHQVFTNILQNSIDAMTENCVINPQLRVFIEQVSKIIIITLEDNGPGFPKENRARLLEPYYTTREKGTGLGLSIVSKIVADHGGKIKILDSLTLGGAKVSLEFLQD
jgi:two-component system nitrogen regulation sensor histidine kinase NtrY